MASPSPVDQAAIRVLGILLLRFASQAGANYEVVLRTAEVRDHDLVLDPVDTRRKWFSNLVQPRGLAVLNRSYRFDSGPPSQRD